ncbi:MAG: MATE family efflux transporter [Lachnospiraceae bacterium]|nr:MATE family efflux transporter [Lachnospiraceae bacterium]
MSQQISRTSGEKEQKSMVKDLTSGSVPVLLLSFAAPLFVSNALQAIYNIVDMIVVGQVIGKTGMSAVSIGGNVLQIMTFIAMGFSSAGQILIARSVGQRNMDQVRKIIGTLFTVLFFIALAIAAACFCIRHHLLSWINTPAEAFDYTMDYTMICILGLVFIYGYNCVSAILRGMGDSKRPFIFISIAAVMNTVLDIFFVAVLKMEVTGAALATVIGQAFSFLFAISYLYRNRESFGFDFRLESFVPDRKAMSSIITLGIPMALQSAAITISQTVVAAWVNSFGVVYSAIAGVLSKLNMMMSVLSNAVTTAGASMTGQNIGAGKYDRVPGILAWALGFSSVIACISSGLLLVFPDFIISMFTTDADVLAEAAVIIGPAILCFAGAATRTFAFSIINGSGNSRLNLLVAIIDGVIARIGCSYIFGFVMGMGPKGFWYGDGVAGMMPLLIGGVFFLSGRWKK